ncbi:hypothetical protein J4526_00075 [Desulfurococcaceae archaeon MEX13E-LK6-19]|nr:hypothetical protein J4526_00075 [Desulfurococcaceae archaeon MEX13E-LK6-19]
MEHHLRMLYRLLCLATLVVTMLSTILSFTAYIIKNDVSYCYYTILWFVLTMITLYLYKSETRRRKVAGTGRDFNDNNVI